MKRMYRRNRFWKRCCQCNIWAEGYSHCHAAEAEAAEAAEAEEAEASEASEAAEAEAVSAADSKAAAAEAASVLSRCSMVPRAEAMLGPLQLPILAASYPRHNRKINETKHKRNSLVITSTVRPRIKKGSWCRN